MSRTSSVFFSLCASGPTARTSFLFLRVLRTTAIVFLSFWVSIYDTPAALAYAVTPAETKLLQKIQRDSLRYFIDFSDPETGLVRDTSRPGSPASIAATGFALLALAIGADHQWINAEFARNRIFKTLVALDTKVEHKEGFFYHFLDMRTGKRVWKSEASSIDTALLLAGALTAARYYPGTEIENRALKIYNRVNWNWMLNNSDLICMGWTPESGFLPYYWDSYNEQIILQALALGSVTRPVPASIWGAWFRNEDEYNGHKVIFSHSGSLFTYQYSHAFIDFKNLRDASTDYFENSIQASLANREYSLSFKDKYKSYNEYSWGLSAAPGPGGYKAYGGKPGQGIQDGTIAPHGAIGSLPFTPKESLNAIKYFYLKLRDKIYKKYGFTAAFNIDKKYYSSEYLGIDQGIIFAMIENFLNDGVVWKKFMSLDLTQRWIEKTKIQKHETKEQEMENEIMHNAAESKSSGSSTGKNKS